MSRRGVGAFSPPDDGFLRPIPEDGSETSSALGGGVVANKSHQQLQQHQQQQQQHQQLPQRAFDTMSEASSTMAVLEARSNGGNRSLVSSTGGQVPPGADDEVPSQTSPDDHPFNVVAKCSRESCATLTAALALALAVVIALVFVVVYPTDTEVGPAPTPGTTSQPTLAPISSFPTLGPSMPPTSLGDVLDTILFQVSDPSTFENDSTPQYKARNWMLATDLLRNDVQVEGATRVTQRYILAVLYYAMIEAAVDDVTGTNTGFLLGETSECEWEGVTCDPNLLQHVVSGLDTTLLTLSGNLPSELIHLSSLAEVDMSANGLGGTIPQEWFEVNSPWQSLSYLDISSNSLSGNIPSGLFCLPSLGFLYLDGNQFTGSIERASVNCTSSSPMQDLRLALNSLTGTLPSWLYSLSSLQYVIAYGNNFTGSLPSVDPPSFLLMLDLSFNNMTGNLPSSLLRSNTLQRLYLDNNLFSGTLPSLDEPNIVDSFIDIWLNNNQFTGEIPANFGLTWTNLEKLRLNGNGISGILGTDNLTNVATWCNETWPSLQEMTADCSGSAPVQCSCCNCTARRRIF